MPVPQTPRISWLRGSFKLVDYIIETMMKLGSDKERHRPKIRQGVSSRSGARIQVFSSPDLSAHLDTLSTDFKAALTSSSGLLKNSG